MEINDGLLQLCKSNDFVNIELAYITAVESGMISFMEFLLLLFMVRDKTNDRYAIQLQTPNHYTPAAKRMNYDLLNFTLSIEFTDNGKTGRISYHKSGKHPTFNNNSKNISYTINKQSLIKIVEALFKPEYLEGRKKGVIKFLLFLNMLTQLEKQIDSIHADFKIWLGYGDKV